MRPFLPLLTILMPLVSQAQYWRIQASGGIAVGLQVGEASRVYVGQLDPRYVSPGFYTDHIPEGGDLFPAWGLSLSRRMGNLELGVQAEAVALRSKWQTYAMMYNGAGVLHAAPVELTGYVGRPVVPLTLVCNYYAGPQRGCAYVGLHAGAAFAGGKEQADFREIALARKIELHYNSAWGFAAGIQAGYRKEIGPVDLGFQLQAKYLQFNLTHGSSDTKYLTKMLALPVQLCAGYRFGYPKPKPVPVEAPAE